MSVPSEPSVGIRDWLLPRILELSHTAWNSKAYAEDCGDDGAPSVWYFELRFHLYCISREDASWILNTSRLRRSEERRHGEYRTKRGVLEFL